MKKLKKNFFFIFGIKSHNAEKTERRNPLGFSNIHSVAKHQKKMQGLPFEEKIFRKKIRKKFLAVPKKIERGDSLVSPGMICYEEKQVKPFWSSSLGQMVLFDTIIFCRTFKNYFGQFVWIEKKRVTIIVAFHFMKRRLKNLTLILILSRNWSVLVVFDAIFAQFERFNNFNFMQFLCTFGIILVSTCRQSFKKEKPHHPVGF